MTGQTESRWRLSSAGNRIMWAVVAAFLTWLVLRGALVPIAVGVVVFLALTAIAATRRNRS